jgi:tetratricopeptide (TPR) repeat protein
MSPSSSHLLAGPWGLPGTLDADVARALEAEDFATALAILRDHLPPQPAPRLLVLMAFLRFQDALEVLQTELMAACQEALGLLERATEAGFPLEAVAPLREEVERVLSEETTRELVAERLTPERAEAAPLEVLLDAASRLRASDPARAAALFQVAARRDTPERAPVHRIDAGIALHEAGRHAEARPLLESALALDWRAPALWPERLHVDWAAALLLEQAHARGDSEAFDAVWAQALALGRVTERPFPANWLNQERLLALLLERRDGARAVQVATRIEASHEYVPRALAERVREARTLAREQAGLGH